DRHEVAHVPGVEARLSGHALVAPERIHVGVGAPTVVVVIAAGRPDLPLAAVVSKLDVEVAGAPTARDFGEDQLEAVALPVLAAVMADAIPREDHPPALAVPPDPVLG